MALQEQTPENLREQVWQKTTASGQIEGHPRRQGCAAATSLPVRRRRRRIFWMKATLTHLLHYKPITLQYPHEKRNLPDNYRGMLALLRYDDGTEKCVGCDLCEAACPSRVIRVVSAEVPGEPTKRYSKEYYMDMTRCLFCGMCVDAHERELRKAGLAPEVIQAAVRIAAVVHAVAVAIEGEGAIPAARAAAPSGAAPRDVLRSTALRSPEQSGRSDAHGP